MEKITPIYSTKLFGHTKITNFFLQSIKKNKISKAYLFFGKKGIGKETFAIHLARFLTDNNIGKEFGVINPNDKLYMSMCNETLDNFLYIKKDTILIDDTKNINDFIHKKTEQTKIILIDSIENASIQAANAMLKAIEDSENVIFLLTSSDEIRVISTIQSRCIKVPFQPLDHETSKTIISNITKAKIDDNILKISDYSPGIYIDLANLQFNILYENIVNNLFGQSITIDTLQKNNIYYTILIVQSILMFLFKKDISIIPEKFHTKLLNIPTKSITDTYFTISSVYTNFINYKLDVEITLYEIYSYVRTLF